MEDVAGNSLSLNQVITTILMLGGLVVALLCYLHHYKNPEDKSALTEKIANRSWSTPQIGILLASLFLLYFLAGFTGLLFYEEQIPLARLVITLLIYSILITLIALINRKRGGSWIASMGMGFRNLRKLILAPVFYMAFIPVLMLASSGYHGLLKLFQSEIELQDVAKVISGELSWLQISYILMAVFVAPIFEELMFRGIIFPYAVRRVGLKPAIGVVSVLFALIHFHVPSLVPLALLSAALCLAYWRTGSLWVSIGMHMIFNAVTILALKMAG